MIDEALIVNLPITNADLAALERLIATENIFVSGNFKIPNLAATEEYLRAKHLRNENFRILFDRNILTRLVNIAKGESIDTGDENEKLTRYAAGCLAFCIVAEIDVEHGMALYEGAFTLGHDHAEKEHQLFLTINNTHPGYCTDIALGRANSIPKDHLQEIGKDPVILAQMCRESNLAKELNLWAPNYLHLLKISELRRKNPTGKAPAELYLRWQAEESFYNAPAAMFGLAAISPKPPKGQMLKKVIVSNSSELSKNIHNATWDVCYITQWGKWLKDKDAPHWLFGSHDVALRKIADIAFCEQPANEMELLQNFFEICWGKRDGAALVKTYEQAKRSAQLGTQDRTTQVNEYFKNIKMHITTLEKSLGIEKI